MQLEKKTEELFKQLSPEEKAKFITKGIRSGLIKEPEDTKFWVSKIPPEEVAGYHWGLVCFWKDVAVAQLELNQEQAKNRIGTMLLIADLTEKRFPEDAKLLRERAKEDAEYFVVDLEKIKESIKN